MQPSWAALHSHIEKRASRAVYIPSRTCSACAGVILPPRRLPAHALVERQLLAHAVRITLIHAQESHNLCATLDSDGAVIVWQLTPLEPVRCLVSE